MFDRREYSVEMSLNGRSFKRVIIDQHYQLKHSDSMNDEIIIGLVKTLGGEELIPESRQGDFEFFKVEPVIWKSKSYRVILTLCVSDDFIGVINAFRVVG